jgi:hypothetical protein
VKEAWDITNSYVGHGDVLRRLIGMHPKLHGRDKHVLKWPKKRLFKA